MSSEINKIAREAGLKLRDASHGITLRVLDSDIRTGVRKNEHACVLAQALKRATGAYRAWINRTVVYIQETPESKDLLRLTHSAKGKREVKRFDRTGKFTAGYYDLLKPHGKESLKEIRAKALRDTRRGKRHEPRGTATKRKAVAVAHDLRAFKWPT